MRFVLFVIGIDLKKLSSMVSLYVLELFLKLDNLLHVVSLSSLENFLRHEFTIEVYKCRAFWPITALDRIQDEIFISTL
jgi:hypothetical protein